MVRIGINPLTWSNDDLPSLGAEMVVDEIYRNSAVT